MITLTPPEEEILRSEYLKYLKRHAELRQYTSKIGWADSFEDWWRAQADNIKDETL